MKNLYKKITSIALAAVMAASMSVGVLAVSEEGSTSVPVTLSAAATTFDVTLPTGLPATIDPDTGETGAASNATIVNGSSGSIRVSKVEIVNKVSGAEGAAATGWYLKSYTAYDFHNADVDSNGVGVSVKPVGGRQALTTNGTALTTDASNEAKQTLLDSSSASADEWVLDAKDGASGGSDELTITYDTRATPVSMALTNQQVASIIITVAWNK